MLGFISFNPTYEAKTNAMSNNLVAANLILLSKTSRWLWVDKGNYGPFSGATASGC